MRAAGGNERPAAEHAPAADRFAREIVGILAVIVVRSRRLMGKPLDGRSITALCPFEPVRGMVQYLSSRRATDSALQGRWL